MRVSGRQSGDDSLPRVTEDRSAFTLRMERLGRRPDRTPQDVAAWNLKEAGGIHLHLG